MREKPRGETDEEDRNTEAFTSALERRVTMRAVKHTAAEAVVGKKKKNQRQRPSGCVLIKFTSSRRNICAAVTSRHGGSARQER